LVNFLWTVGQPSFFSTNCHDNLFARSIGPRFRRLLRLIAARASIQSSTVPHFTLTTETVNSAVHRFEESIAGRPYLIEAVSVSKDRWRAYIVRIPGVPTALMPFYGATPSEAAHQLCEWLTRAHARASSTAGTV
jgi:hypothetical protein